MSSQELVITLEDGVRIIRFNRPKAKNAFNDYFYETLTNTLNEDAKNDEVVVTVVTGLGEYFSSGFDIKSAMERYSDEEKQRQGFSNLKSMIQAFALYPKLLIAVVNGPAIGIGVTLLGLCDIVYASDRANFTTPFVKIGVCPEGCSSYTFPRILGRSKASEVLFLGKTLSAEEAYRFGFVAEVIAHHKLEEFIQNLKKLGSMSVNSVRRAKQLVLANLQDKLLECCDREIEMVVECSHSDEFIAGVMNFMNRKSKL